jgi:pilus assembly protein Flp/PilA
MTPFWPAAGPRKGVHMGFWRDERGQGMIEYALILAVISITIILVLVFMKDQLTNYFSNIGNSLT